MSEPGSAIYDHDAWRCPHCGYPGFMAVSSVSVSDGTQTALRCHSCGQDEPLDAALERTRREAAT